MNEIKTAAELAYLSSPLAIRQQCQRLYDWTLAGRGHFKVNRACLDQPVQAVASLIEQRGGIAAIPFHARWRHFRVGGIDRVEQYLQPLLSSRPAASQLASLIDLVILSVLVDAGAGESWCYRDPMDGEVYRRSEGLAVASFNLFRQGFFASGDQGPMVCADRLQQLSLDSFRDAFEQGNVKNSLLGIEARHQLLVRLGDRLQEMGCQRPADLFLPLVLQAEAQGFCSSISATVVLQTVLQSLGVIWTTGQQFQGVRLADVWYHSALATSESESAWIPFHKLSQWLTYSLLEVFMQFQIDVTDLEQLTGLAEYRNGGLFIDYQVLQFKDANAAQQHWSLASELVIEWRALTILLLDQLAEQLRHQYHCTVEQFPLVKVLEAGTWQAGRDIAARLREDGSPPIHLQRDGSVF